MTKKKNRMAFSFCQFTHTSPLGADTQTPSSLHTKNFHQFIINTQPVRGPGKKRNDPDLLSPNPANVPLGPVKMFQDPVIQELLYANKEASWLLC